MGLEPPLQGPPPAPVPPQPREDRQEGDEKEAQEEVEERRGHGARAHARRGGFAVGKGFRVRGFFVGKKRPGNRGFFERNEKSDRSTVSSPSPPHPLYLHTCAHTRAHTSTPVAVSATTLRRSYSQRTHDRWGGVRRGLVAAGRGGGRRRRRRDTLEAGGGTEPIRLLFKGEVPWRSKNKG